MRLRVGSSTDIGLVRERNDDSFLVKDRLFAVADGMGGHRGGDVASRMAVEALDRLELPDDGALDALVEEIKSANRSVLARGESEQSLQGMGTTLTAFLTDDGRAHVAHVGDSRAYLFRNGALQQLTEDHTLVQRMVREGRLSPEQAEHHPQRSIITRAIGVDDDLTVDPLTLPLLDGDRVLLCTDGLTGMVPEDRIQEILEREPDPQRAADLLVEEANRAGGEDNITVIVVHVEDGDPSSGRALDGEEVGPARADASGSPLTAVVPSASQPAPERADEAPRKPRRRRRVAWAIAIVVVLVAAWLGVRVYLSHQWYVGEANGQVAIYQGIPASVVGFDLSHVRVATAIPAASAERLQLWSDLRDGITADSLEAATEIVDQIRTDLAGTGSTT
jgi:PPM family protein phosphatase